MAAREFLNMRAEKIGKPARAGVALEVFQYAEGQTVYEYVKPAGRIDRARGLSHLLPRMRASRNRAPATM